MTSITKVHHDLVYYIEEQGLRSIFLVQEMKKTHGIRCLPVMLALLGDGDWSSDTLFSKFKLTSLVRAAYQVRKENVVIDDRFLQRLEDKSFWHLNRKQLFRVADELLFLFPERFAHLRRWIQEEEG